MQVGYRHIHWALQATNPVRKKAGTKDDLFVRKDVPLLPTTHGSSEVTEEQSQEREEL